MNAGTNAYHRFLIKHRVYCDLCTAPMPATRVIDHGFKAKVVCDSHFRAYTAPDFPNRKEKRERR